MCAVCLYVSVGLSLCVCGLSLCVVSNEKNGWKGIVIRKEGGREESSCGLNVRKNFGDLVNERLPTASV